MSDDLSREPSAHETPTPGMSDPGMSDPRMSDPEVSVPELSASLRSLAGSGAAPAPMAGAQVRRRAVTRRRRRHAALAGGAAVAVAALAFGLTSALDGGSDARPAPPAAPSTRSAAPAATVDLGTRTLTLDGRRVPVSSGSTSHPTRTGRMTVVAKHRVKRLTSESVGLGDEYDVKLPWVVELRGPDGRANFILAMTYAEGAPGVRDSTRGAIGLRSADARWVYGRLSPGAVVAVRG
ncbi:L,D-transpeptidase [Streptomyces spectabilis]|uniref:L,D-transpeptidase n=1 Tax=Streptomyces spectabilis TaxID=68270 RepID=A0A516R847_STRST|nr:L,D-transpeptidase [Streptomyces spectabilis]QDQ11831.1 L,D-transpeptidase [Streptomyces spectabilis]